MNIKEKALHLHRKHRGKMEMRSKVSLKNQEDLSTAYSPGVAEPCRAIHKNPADVFTYTNKGNSVAVVTDGSAVLGLGNIGPLASLPVMEGKAILLKEFAGVDAFPVCLDSENAQDFIQTVKAIAPSYGGINLEDIAAPQCIEIEESLKDTLDIPVFHDDQHGTAIVTTAALINACKLIKKDINTLRVVMSGTGAAGTAIAKMLKHRGVRELYAFNTSGVVKPERKAHYDSAVQKLIENNLIDSPPDDAETLEDLLENADVFVGVSAGNLLTKNSIAKMNKDPLIFAMANPTPEISPEEAKAGGAAIIGTGRSDYPNQINNVLAFPGIFRGALDARSPITEPMKQAAADAIAEVLSESELHPEAIIPSPFDKRVVSAVSEAVKKEALK